MDIRRQAKVEKVTYLGGEGNIKVKAEKAVQGLDGRAIGRCGIWNKV